MNTIPTGLKLTPQVAFDFIVAHLRKQGRKALQDDRCVYRATDGAKCAAGCLIPDDKYNSLIEGISASSVCERLKLGWDRAIEVIFAMQGVHDTLEVNEWESAFCLVARRYKLQHTPRENQP